MGTGPLARLVLKGRSHVDLHLVGHKGGSPRGEFCFTLTVTEIATGWTEPGLIGLVL